MPQHRWNRRWLQLAVLLTLLAGLGATLAAYAQALWQWRSAQRAVAAEDWLQAQQRLESCRWWWYYNPAWHWYYARVCRGVGEWSAAERHLLQASRLGYDAQAVALESALLRYQQGDDSVEAYLWQRYEQGDAQECAAIVAVLVPRLFAQFRLPEVGPLSARWVEWRPESALAWQYRAQVLERLHPNGLETVEAWRQWWRLAPQEPQAGIGLARLLMQRREEMTQAVALLEQLLQRWPAEEAAQLLLAECYLMLGQQDKALPLLERCVTHGSKPAQAYWLRGRWYLQRGEPAAAVRELRQAVAQDPSSPEVWYSLFQALQQAGAPPDEVRQVEQRWRQCDADLRRASQLARLVGERPRDADLRQQLGELFLRHGREVDGLRWLQSALQLQPDHPATHRLLADYYDRQGRSDLAAVHRRYLSSPAATPATSSAR